MILSIIIPIYNGEKYLSQCLDSIIDSGLNNIEIIAINDGSSDSSLEILTKYSSSYPFIRIINQKNSGVSAARNIGISHAKGKYITFIDADDYVISNVFYDIVKNELPNMISDFIISGYARISDNGDSHIDPFKEGIYSDEYIKEFIGKGWIGKIESVWAKFYLREIIKNNNIKFPIGVSMYEDGIFNYSYLKFVSKLNTTNKVFYCYRKNPGSATTQFKGMKAIENISTNYKAAITYFGIDNTEILSKVQRHYSYCVIAQIYTIYRNKNVVDKTAWLKKYVSYANNISPYWLKYLHNGLPGFIAKFLKKGRFVIISAILNLVFKIEKIKI